MTICLVVQKDTLENGKVKAILKEIDTEPKDFVANIHKQFVTIRNINFVMILPILVLTFKK